MRAAIVGAGRMGRRHVQVVRQSGLDLVGIADISRDALALAVTEQGVPRDRLFDGAAELIEKTRPECVIIATTAPTHCEYTCVAARGGAKYILVEKPLAVSLDECERMIGTCQQFGAKLAVNHQMRFMEQYSKPKALLDGIAYGGFKSMTVVGGNFGTAMNGTHYFEAFRYLADEEPTEVTAWFCSEVVPNPRGTQFEDRAGSIRVVTASGKRLYMEIGADQGHGLQVTYAGRNGMIAVNELTGEMIASVREAPYRELPTTRYGMPADITHETITPAEVIDSSAQVLNALLADRPDNVTAQHGMIAIRVLVAAYVSAENGSIPVRLDSELDLGRVFPWA